MKTYTYDAVVIGTGAAGYNAACRLKQFGCSVAIVTEATNCGTSRNTGSDKQTYYKLGLAGDCPDSVTGMAKNLFAGGSVDGDNALCEAALSARCFLNLCELGVEFPTNRYGEFIGYKTDNDPFERATSAGPLTSKQMTEVLQKKAEELGIETFSGYLAVEILKHENKACGVLCVEKADGEPAAFRSGNIIMATGGPGGIYADSVYPQGHTGTTSLALLAGARAQNLTEWQYGLASIRPRWNVSGTYMQVLPRFVSVDPDGTEHEFLLDFFADPYEALSMVFLKGYQWPFESRKALKGSSVLDLLVYRECALRGRRVFLDYTKNPFGMEALDFTRLSEEAYTYLSKAQACFGTPIERLVRMNLPAVELYGKKGVDIRKEYLEIALCAQHNNGGVAVDGWWQTCVDGLFAAGECAGTHGVTRPGGSALNAGQVGSLRAATYIAQNPNGNVPDDAYEAALERACQAQKAVADAVLGGENNVRELMKQARRRMSDRAAAFRDRAGLESALKDVRDEIAHLKELAKVDEKSRLYLYYKLRDILVTQEAVLTAMLDFAENAGCSRGSALYYDEHGELRSGLEEMFRFSDEKEELRTRVQETFFDGEGFRTQWRDVRALPERNDFFENVWRGYRTNRNVERR